MSALLKQSSSSFKTRVLKCAARMISFYMNHCVTQVFSCFSFKLQQCYSTMIHITNNHIRVSEPQFQTIMESRARGHTIQKLGQSTCCSNPLAHWQEVVAQHQSFLSFPNRPARHIYTHRQNQPLGFVSIKIGLLIQGRVSIHPGRGSINHASEL